MFRILTKICQPSNGGLYDLLVDCKWKERQEAGEVNFPVYRSLQMSISDKLPASCCITHEITHLLPPSRKEERRRKEKKGKERREGERRRKTCSIEAILNNQSVKLF